MMELHHFQVTSNLNTNVNETWSFLLHDGVACKSGDLKVHQHER